VASSLEKLQKNYDVEIHWRSFMLRPPGSPPIPPEYRARIEASHTQLEKMAREQYGLELHPGPFGIDSRPALIAAKYAESQGKGNAFHAAGMHAYWQEGRSIDDPEVLREIAASVGLETEHFAATNPEYSAEVDEDMAEANAYGLQAVPALIFAEKYLLSGAQPYELLVQVVEKLQKEGV